MQCDKDGAKANLKKLWPSAVVLAIGILGGFTNALGSTIREALHKAMEDFTTGLTPYVVNFIILVVALNIAYVAYHPLCHWMQKWIGRSKMTQFGKDVSYKIAKPLYWVGITLVLFTMFAPDIMAKLTVGVGLFGAAVVVALKDSVTDLISYGRMEFWNSIKVGDEIELIGIAVKGKVVKIDYFETTIEGEKSTDTVSNKEITAKGFRRLKPGVLAAGGVAPPAAPKAAE